VAERPTDGVAHLTPPGAGEPRGADARLTGEMTHQPSDHAAHDELLIASLLDRSVEDPTRRRAEAMVASCEDCAALHRDLLVLSAATRALPTPPRPRDFTLSAADVERLRPSGWRRLIRAVGSSRDLFSRPLAIGLTTIGLAGLLVGTVPDLLSGQAATSAVPPSVGQALGAAGANPESTEASRAASAPSAAPSAAPPPAAAQLAPTAEPSIALAPAPLAPSPAALPSGSTNDTFVAGPEASGGAAEVAPDGSSLKNHAIDGTTSSVPSSPEPLSVRTGLLGLSGLLLLLGLGLFALRWTARRLADG
jgi:hypothetical protein